MEGRPTRDELRQLPTRAIVAYAARCARRLQSSSGVPGSSPESILPPLAVEHAIRSAEAFALGEPVANPWSAAAAARSAVAATAATGGAIAAMAAANAAMAAAAATQAADPSWLAWSVSLGADVEAARRDFDQLRELELGQYLGLGEPIDPSETGPLGPLRPRS
jgi:hypothetical protein